MAGRFEIYRERTGGYSFCLKTRQGQVVATGKSFATKEDARRGVATLLLAAAGAQVDDRTKPEPSSTRT
jgi:uncharacterized protein